MASSSEYVQRPEHLSLASTVTFDIAIGKSSQSTPQTRKSMDMVAMCLFVHSTSTRFPSSGNNKLAYLTYVYTLVLE